MEGSVCLRKKIKILALSAMLLCFASIASAESFQIGDQASFQYAVEELLKNNRYITNIFSEYFPGRYYYNAITKDDDGVITVQIVS